MDTDSPTCPAVLVIGFNRAHLMYDVLSRIHDARPAALYACFDGPRTSNEALLCEETVRQVERFSWDCKVATLVSLTNLGCRRNVVRAIDWFFENVEEGVILEDDVVPTLSFFRYANELLSRYRNDVRVWSIAGFNPFGEWDAPASYFFAEGSVWGWATWRRAWVEYANHNVLMKDEAARARARVFFGRAQFRRVWPLIERAADGITDTWDYQWTFTRAARGGLSAIPARNLIENIGFGGDATHTAVSPVGSLPEAHDLTFPLVHPTSVVMDRDYQRRMGNLVHPGLGRRVGRRAKRGLTRD